MTWPRWERSLVPIATTSPVETLRGSVPPRCTVCRVTSWTVRYAAVSQLVTANRCRMMPLAAWTRPISSRTTAHMSSWSPVLGGDAAVDGAADHGRHHRLRAHPDDAEEHPADEGAPLAPGHPPQEAPRRPVVGGAGVVEGEVAHSPNATERGVAGANAFRGVRGHRRRGRRRSRMRHRRGPSVRRAGRPAVEAQAHEERGGPRGLEEHVVVASGRLDRQLDPTDRSIGC